MSTQTEGKTPGDWLLYESQSLFSRTASTLATGGKRESGTVMGQITASKELVPWDPAAADGSEVVAGLLYATVDATTAAKPCILIDTHAMVTKSGLTYGAGVTTNAHREAAVAGLRGLGIKAV